MHGGSRLVRVGAKVVVVSVVLAGLVWLIGWLHLRGGNGGMEDLGIAIGYGLVILGLAAIAVIGLLVMLGAAAVSAVQGRRQQN